MNLHRLLQQRAEAGRPVRVGLIGAGKFGSMFLSQVPTTRGLGGAGGPDLEPARARGRRPQAGGVGVAVVADLDPERARATCRKVGWDDARIARTRFVASGAEACGDPEVE